MHPTLHHLLLTSVVLAHALSSSTEARQDNLTGQDAAQEQEFVTRSFSIPDVRAVQADWAAAEAHAAAGRWSDAVALWQRMLEQESATVLAGALIRDARGSESQQLVHAGAAPSARAKLLALPKSARDAYQLRYEPQAARLYAGALAAQDEAGLLTVAARWPLCKSAVQAAFAAGDLAWERGDLTSAHDAWSRAVGLLNLTTRGPRTADDWRIASQMAESQAGLQARCAVIITWLGAYTDDDWPARGAALVGEGKALGPTPSADAGGAGAARRIASAQSDPLVRATRNDALWPTVAGDSLLINTGLRLLALSSWTGDVLWDSKETRGWESLSPKRREDCFLGVDRQNLMLGACVADGVAVAPLQLPYTRLPQQKFNNINITTPLPERRLFGYELATGRPLWSHEPAPGWDGESGSLVERGSVAAPPVAIGHRVLVPVVRMQGRIDYHVVCVDARDGSTLWSTNLVSGQRELNMFGRAEHEFSACPLVVHDGKVIALTQLGAIAALDLHTGEILWETLYERIELPRTQDFRAPAFRTQWRNAPPVIADGCVLATPFDSRELVAVDLESGALLWSLAHATINRAAGAMSQLNVLVGADRTTIVLGGEMLAAMDAPQGVSVRGPMRLRWRREPEEEEDPFTGRASLARGRVVWPLREGRVELDLATGETLLAAAWPDRQAAGNVLPLAGALVVVSHTHVQTIFDWDALVARARTALMAASSSDTERAERALDLAQLLDGRAEALSKLGRNEQARALFEEARELLESLPSDRQAALRGRLHRLLRGEARVHAALAQPDRAVELLHRARALALEGEEIRWTLLEELELRRRMRTDPSEVLQALAQSGGTVRVRFEEPGASPAAAEPVYVDVLAREAEALIEPTAEEAETATELSTRLYARLEQLRVAEALRLDANCYRLLYDLAATHGEEALAGSRIQDLCAARIALMQAAGRRTGFDAFEREARSALENLDASADIEAVERLARQWPGTEAAADAADRILVIAARNGDLRRAAQMTLAGLPPQLTASACSPKEAEALARLAFVAHKAGAHVYAASLAQALSTQHGALPLQLEDGATTLAQWSAQLPRYGHEDPFDAAATFRAEGKRFEAWGGFYEFLGRVLPSEPEVEWTADRARTALFAQLLDGGGGDLVLRLLVSDDDSAPRWTQRIDQSEIPPATQLGFFGGRVFQLPGLTVLALKQRIIGLRASDGELAWSTPVEALGLAYAEGVLVARDAEARLHGIEAQTGVLLWRESDAQGVHATAPLCGAGCVLSMPAPGRRSLIVRDLWTGRMAARVELDTTVAAGIERDAWIDGGRLLLPWFNEVREAKRNQIAVHALPSGEPVARIGFEEPDGTKRVLNQVVSQAGQHWALLRPWAGGTINTAPQPLLVRIDAQRGELDPTASHKLGFEDRIAGVTRFQRMELPPGPVFLLGVRPNQAQREARVRAYDLTRGELWNASVGIPYDEVQHGLQPPPLMSEHAAVVCLTQYDRRLPTPDFRTRLYWFDPTSGLSLGTRDLPAAERGDSPVLVPLADKLLVRTRTQLEMLK